ncbi:MAG: hypothetical protein L0207_02495 [Chlamydiae bacterium]|nr:hypothetical protein [Chlamydiota bacterium]
MTFTPSRIIDFLTISDDSVPNLNNPDLFVGKNKEVTITLNNGSTSQTRDIVVLGKLKIQSSDEDQLLKPKLIFQNCIVAGKLHCYNIEFNGEDIVVFESNEEFRKKLFQLFIEWTELQRESVEKIGLTSILFKPL